ncbi:pentatricopeptide repeat-containing protein At2g03880, mitochondrial-like [Primulina eburnea]|uniref:pentatricopeptide repeat-containing protein At2g03880, mitochondrial-like n=1 Tax=Primulina eburnea TaxID=1245227 RepID=UPI003C6C4F20
MGRDFASLPMLNHPSNVIRGVLLTAHRFPRRCSTQCPSKKNRVSWFCSRSSLGASAVRTTEIIDGGFSCERNRKRFVLVNGFKEQQTPFMERSADRAISLSCFSGRDVKARLIWYSEMLRNCSNELCLAGGKAIHGRIVRCETKPDVHLWISLINFYAKCGALEVSRNVFEQMPTKEVVSWTALISGFVARGYGVESVELFCEMRREDVRPNEFTLATVLKGCSMISDLELGKQLHAEVVKIGRLSDVFVGSILIDLYAKCGEMEYADDVFSLMPEKNAVSWNALLNGYAQAGHGEAVLQLFCEMSELEMRFSNHTLSIILKGVACSSNFRGGRAIHSMVIKVGGELDDFVSCSLVNMYSKSGLVNDALKVFKGIKDPDIVAWSSIIGVLDQQGQKEEAAKLFCLMRHSGVRPNQFTFASIISAATDLGDLKYGKSIHACAHKFGFDYDDLVSNALISMYMKFRSIYDGYDIFNRMTKWDVVSWNALLSGFHDEKTSDQGHRIFKQMLTEGYRPNLYSFISTLRSCSSLLNIEFGKQVHSLVIKESFDDDAYVGTALIDMYGKCGCMEDVEVIFNRLNEKDVFTWTVLISGYSQTNQAEKSVQCFNQMRRDGFTPNEFTLASCLNGSSEIASLEIGRQLHSLTVKAGQSDDMFVASALIDMYGKCGHIDAAESLFNDTQLDDTVIWNTIICAYSQHGQDDKALQAFRRMMKENVLPDVVTFVGILAACSHLGLVEEGKKHFYSMRELFGTSPCIEHYACMVDMFGRAGKFDEVENLVDGMELTPNALIWENVLGACRAHGNVKLGERAAEKLFQIDPETGSNYILLSNIYASRRMWDDVSRIRASMSSKGIKKEPGCSWVEIDAQVHVFLSQDATHPCVLDIHQKLEELGQRLAVAGYVPNTDYVLHNVPDNEKRENLFHHSERLALGFALTRELKSGKIRIFKNLRICGDCHEYMKFASRIINKEIAVRDTRRFHYFRNGFCSCKDYW